MLYYSVSTSCARGQRRYMEDRVILKRSRDKINNRNDLFFCIMDGHGGPQASEYVKERLWTTMKNTDGFRSDNDEEVLEAMRQSFLKIHHEMEEPRNKWPKRPNGYASTAGTTCSCALIRNNKIYTAHCGDSRVVLLTENDDGKFVGVDLTKDHKPEEEQERIERDGGKVARYTPVARVMWTREIVGINNNKTVESIPFLSIARSLGDYWSYNESTGKYSVSPEPDLAVREIDFERDAYILLISDGITNVLSSNRIADLVDEWRNGITRNISRYILKSAIAAWRNMKADNMSVISVGLHKIDEEPRFNSVRELDHISMESQLTSYPRDIVLVYPDEILTTLPEWDDTILVRDDDDNFAEDYMGPGYINRKLSPSETLTDRSRRLPYLTIHTRTPKIIYSSTKFRARFHTQPSLDRLQYKANLNRSIGSALEPVKSSFVLNRRSSGLFWPKIESSPVPQRAASLTPQQASDDDDDVKVIEEKPLRQSWPADQNSVITLVDKSESKIIIRPQSTKFRVKRVWTKDNTAPNLNDNLVSEEDNEDTVQFTPKRKRNLETDEIGAKRQNCQQV